MLQVKGQFKERLVATDVVIIIPVPSDASSPRFSVVKGSVVWAPEDSAIIWSINSIKVSYCKIFFNLISDGNLE